MRAVAKRLVGALPAAAEGNDGASGKAEGGSRGVEDLKFAFDPDGTVVQNSNFGWHSRGWYHGGNVERAGWGRADGADLPAEWVILGAF